MNAKASQLANAASSRAPGAFLPIGFGDSPDEMLQAAYGSYRDQEAATLALGSRTRDLLRHYDVPGMESAVAICFWGRSGSFLLASYLDGHDDIVMLPMNAGESIYPFLQSYASLSVWEKLVSYPAYCAVNREPLFEGDFAIAAADYYAAVQALFAAYGDAPQPWLAQRSAFFQLLHVAYALATGQRPGNPRPLMIYAQHWTDEDLAARFVEDFPSARFIHTVRDPISAIDSWFDRVLELKVLYSRPSDPGSCYFACAVDTVRDLLTWDRAHKGMDARTRLIRFEDLHLTPEVTMRRLADWLGIPYRPSLLDSTFNRIPYVVESGGKMLCGAFPANAKRRCRNLSVTDRLLIFALLHDNFVEWDYPSPRVMRRRWVRLCTIASLWVVPMRMELAAARWLVRMQVLPKLRHGRVGSAGASPVVLLKHRLKMMLIIATQARLRLSGNRILPKPL